MKLAIILFITLTLIWGSLSAPRRKSWRRWTTTPDPLDLIILDSDPDYKPEFDCENKDPDESINITTQSNPNSAIDLNICGDWIAYRKQKCIKILPIRGTYNEAIVNCQQDNANVITINDQDEQEFMMDILQEFNTTADRAWANHPTDSAYANWEDIPDTKYYRNRNEIPIHISLSAINYGKWYDERLSRKALIGCEKRQEWTVGLLSAALESVVKVVNQLNEQVKMGHTRVIPEGFVYIQLNNQSEPRDLWPWANWTDVTPDMSELLMDSNQLNGIQVKDENRAESQAVKVWKRM